MVAGAAAAVVLIGAVGLALRTTAERPVASC